jgi:hypothetical protein
MNVGQTITHGGATYTITRIGEQGTGKFFGMRVIDLTDADGNEFYVGSKNGRIGWNAKVHTR